MTGLYIDSLEEPADGKATGNVTGMTTKAWKVLASLVLVSTLQGE